MAADNLSLDLLVLGILRFKLITSHLQQNCYQSPHLVFHLVQFNSISITENLYDRELDNAPVFLHGNDASSYQEHLVMLSTQKPGSATGHRELYQNILFQTTKIIPPYLQGNRFSLY